MEDRYAFRTAETRLGTFLRILHSPCRPGRFTP